MVKRKSMFIFIGIIVCGVCLLFLAKTIEKDPLKTTKPDGNAVGRTIAVEKAVSNQPTEDAVMEIKEVDKSFSKKVSSKVNTEAFQMNVCDEQHLTAEQDLSE